MEIKMTAAKYVLIIVLALLALVLVYRAGKIAPVIFKREENQEEILKIKIFGLIVGIVDFILALLLI